MYLELVALAPKGERLLGKSAVSMFRTLHKYWVRDKCDFYRPLDEIALNAGLSYPTAKKSLRRLRDAGMIRTMRKRYPKRVKSDGHGGIEPITVNRYIIKAIYKKKTIYVDKENFNIWVVKEYQNRKDFKNYGYIEHLRDPVIDLKLINSGFSFFQKEKQQRVSQHRCSSISLQTNMKKKKPPDNINLEDILDSDIVANIPDILARHGPRQEPDEPPPVLPRLSRPKRTRQAHDIIPDHVGDIGKVKYLIDSYNAAVHTVFGKKSYAFSRGNIRKFKYFNALLLAANTCIEHEIAPEAWAEWSINGLRKGRFKHKPPPITVVFSAKNIVKRRGWFRNTYDMPEAKYDVEQEHYEQLFRRREATARWRGIPKNPLSGLPRWYAEMRAEEIEQGFDDPLELYPKLRDHGR